MSQVWENIDAKKRYRVNDLEQELRVARVRDVVVANQEPFSDARRNRFLPPGHQVHIRNKASAPLKPPFGQMELDSNAPRQCNLITAKMRKQPTKAASQSFKL